MSSSLDFENPVFAQFSFYSVILAMKMIFLGLLTVRVRVKRKVFEFPEDCLSYGFGKHNLKPGIIDSYIERIRRCHLNDLESNVPFLIVGFFFVFSNPDPVEAAVFFRGFTLIRCLHTLAFLHPFPQPCRTILYFIGVMLNGIMALRVLGQSQF